MTTKEAVALLERYSNYDGMGIPNLAGCKEAMRVAVDALKESCPELAESEDERIRKELIGMVKFHCADEDLDRYLGWLEKQKEHNSEDEECTDFTIYHPLKNGKGKYECIPYSFYGSLTSFSEDKDLIDFLRTCFYTKEECKEWIEKQKEPHYTKRNALFDKCVENCDPAVMKKVSDEIDEMLEKERKPAEWSAKGRRGRIGSTPEHIRKKAENFLSKMEPPYDADDICSAYETGAMESTKLEWSEEDEKIIERLITRLNWITHNTRTDGTSPNITFFDEIDWLKSLPMKCPKKSDNCGSSEEQDYSDLSDLERAIHRGFLCAGVKNVSRGIIEDTAKEVLVYARKQLLSYADESNPAIEAMADLERTFECNPDKLPGWLKNELDRIRLEAHTKGYNKGYKDAEKQYNESVAYHFPIMPTWAPPCYHGGPCTNPMKDCINCPRANVVISPNTASGTSTSKSEG